MSSQGLPSSSPAGLHPKLRRLLPRPPPGGAGAFQGLRWPRTNCSSRQAATHGRTTHICIVTYTVQAVFRRSTVCVCCPPELAVSLVCRAHSRAVPRESRSHGGHNGAVLAAWSRKQEPRFLAGGFWSRREEVAHLEDRQTAGSFQQDTTNHSLLPPSVDGSHCPATAPSGWSLRQDNLLGSSKACSKQLSREKRSCSSRPGAPTLPAAGWGLSRAWAPGVGHTLLPRRWPRTACLSKQVRSTAA